jgi:hypothetical protein
MSNQPNPNVFFRSEDMGIGNFPIKGGTINDGGPAFARTGADGHTSPQIGMSIRDYFAAAALQGNLASQSIDVGYYDGEDAWNKAASDAYKAADAMLKAREAK